MRYSFTGPSLLDTLGRNLAHDVVAGLEDVEEITTGAARGWDMAVAFAAIELWPSALHRVICPGASFARQELAWLVERAINLRVERFQQISLAEELSAGLAYRRRNEQLVEHADVLVAGVHSTRFYRSGEWMTINIAKKRRVPVRFEVVP